jgi:hypothetical protein
MNIAPRKGDFIQTYTGRQFWPIDPRAEDIFIKDIAHALSLQCRYAGHCKQHYSVAEHSVLVAQWVLEKTGDKRKAFAGLMHDAQEAYVVDVPRPLKPFLAGYKEIEDRVWRVIAVRYGLDPELPAEVKEADNRILTDERRVNMASGDYEGGWPDLAPLDIRIECLSAPVAEIWFMDAFRRLSQT